MLLESSQNIQNAFQLPYKYGWIVARIPPQSHVTPKFQLIKFQQLAAFLYKCIQRIRVWVLLRMRSKCFDCCLYAVRLFRMQSECSLNTLQMLLDISPLQMHLERFEHEQNIRTGHKNGPDYLECTQNAGRIIKIHFEYPGIYHEFSFQQHSSSFCLQCDQALRLPQKHMLLILFSYCVLNSNRV